jgi:hypothetical protein
MSDDRPDPIRPPVTAAAIAAQVRQSLDMADLDTLGALLSPDVRWGPPGSARPPCRNRDQVLAWYAKGREQGRRATVTEVEVHHNALLVGLRLEDGHERWQVMRVGPDGINEITGFDDRPGASRQLGS